MMQRLRSIFARHQSDQDSSEFAKYRRDISRFNASQPNSALLDAIRAYNHQCVDSLDRIVRLREKHLLEIGASPHGYSLERALEHGVIEYVGVGLDVSEPVEVRNGDAVGRLLPMNAQDMDLPDCHFDLVLSISTFEHVSNVPAVLSEIRRVLRSGGKALITFEPVWTCAYGHHLHHFGEISEAMPAWAHLIWSKAEMLERLSAVWPANASPTLVQAAEWVYDSDVINRIGLSEMKRHFQNCGMTVDWMLPLQDDPRDPDRLAYVVATVGLPASDLTTKGLSVLLSR